MPNSAHITLGIHFGHSASAAILVNERIVADIAEERFNHCKHTDDLPLKSILYCLKAAATTIENIDEIVIAGHIGPKHAREFEMTFGYSISHTNEKNIFEEGQWGQTKNFFVPLYMREAHLHHSPSIKVIDHHLAHAASAYYTNSYNDRTLIATMDSVGDNVSTALWRGENGDIVPLLRYDTSASLGMFYSNVTHALGWWIDDGEGKTMGLASYGNVDECRGCLEGFYPQFSNGILVEPHYYPHHYTVHQRAACHNFCNESIPIASIIERYGRENIAAESQRILEEQVLQIVLPWLYKEQTTALATAGGLFLNVKLNQRLWYSNKITHYFPFGNAGDAGIALGAALYAAAQHGLCVKQNVKNLYLGPSYTSSEIEDLLRIRGLKYQYCSDIEYEIAKRLSQGQIVGWFQGRMESGPRALGNRSILMAPYPHENKQILNTKVKFRELFRPYCPSILSEAKENYIIKPRNEFFMVTSFDCVPGCRELIPAVVHVDGSLRPQFVEESINPRYWKILNTFYQLTSIPVVLNTSLNLAGEPIVCHPSDALRVFFDSGISILAIENYLVFKS